MAQRGICSNCADQSDMEENSFMALNLKSGLTQSVQAKPCNLADPSVTASNIGSREYIHSFHAGFEPEYERQQHFWLQLENSAT